MPDIDHTDAATVGRSSGTRNSFQGPIIPCECVNFSGPHHLSSPMFTTLPPLLLELTVCSSYRLTSVHVYESLGLAACSSYRLTPVYVYESELSNCLVECRTERSLHHAKILAELPVLTDFGACPLVKLACLSWSWDVRMRCGSDALRIALRYHSWLGWSGREEVFSMLNCC